MKQKAVLGPAVTGITLLFSSIGTFAESGGFADELSLGINTHESSEDNDGFSLEGKATAIEYIHYFNPVKNNKYPIAEAAFVERVPVFKMKYTKDEIIFKNNETTIIEGDGDQLELSYTHRSSSSPVLLQIVTNYGRTDHDYPEVPDISAKLKSNSIGIFAGYYIQEAMALRLGYERGKGEFNWSNPFNYTGFDDSTFNWNEINLEYKYAALFDQDRAWDIMLSFQTTDYEFDGESKNSEQVEAWLTYYFNRMVSLSLGIYKVNSDEVIYKISSNEVLHEGRGATLAGNFYINNNLSFLVAYGETDSDSADYGDDKSFWANANYKF